MGAFSKTSDRLRRAWRTVTTGLNAEELWVQFRRETRTSISVYSAETGRNLPEEWSKRGHRAKLVFSVLAAMFMRLSPTRRLLLLIAGAFLLAPEAFVIDNVKLRVDLPGATFAAFLLLALLVLELADRVGLKRDLEIARDIQRMLLPEAPPALAGIEVAFATKPANTVAGDYYDAFLRPGPDSGDRLLLIVADVAGKGIPAGMLMATIQTSVHVLAAEPRSVDALAAKLNRSTCDRSGGGRHFITAFVAEFDPATRVLAWVNAGHNPPLLVRAREGIERLEQGGLPFGIIEAAAYESGQTILQPGDTLYIYTDGVTEAADESDAEFGEERLSRLASELRGTNAAGCLRRVLDSVDRFAAGVPQYDDITCLVFRVSAAAS